ncbi:MAG: hypothetical protein A4E35_02337 [Methanoregula sp. PtaU1.Bin051]|nr:MAG: hypothetical protein A4E35_02337 [Methanoregula sp. PtaU1.Bin051]
MPARDDAVSPVVGVMLMLSITIMIAAIVSAVAGGLSSTDKKAPSAILDVAIYSSMNYGGYSVPALTISHISGNVLPTKDLSIIMYYRNPKTGTVIKGNLSGEHAVEGDGWTGYSSGQFCGVLFLNDERFGNPVRDDDGGYASWFGNASATFRPGDILVTPGQYCGSTNPHNTGMEYLFPGVDFDPGAGEFPAGYVVNVKIIHTPSGQILLDKDVIIR